MHPLRAALRLHASPSLSEGEVFRLPLDVRGGTVAPPSPLMPKGELKGV